MQWLNSYTGQSTDQLIALEQNYRTDSIVLAFEDALRQKEERVGIAGLTDAERVVLAVEALEAEVNNGGYWSILRESISHLRPLHCHRA